MASMIIITPTIICTEFIVIFFSTFLPKNEPINADRQGIFRFLFLHAKATLKRLLKRCTIAVNAIAISIGKNTANTVIRIVSNPNPDKNVMRAVKEEIIAIIMYSMLRWTYYIS